MAVEDYVVEVPSKPNSHRHKLRGGPIDDKTQAQEAFAAYGRAVASWARAEQHIDLIIMQINKVNFSTPSLNIYRREPPANFPAKVKYVQRFFRRHPALKNFEKAIIDVTHGLTRLAKERHALAHGVFEEFDAENQRVIINNVQWQRAERNYRHRHRVIKLQSINAIIDLNNRANELLIEVSAQLFRPDAVTRLHLAGWDKQRWWHGFRDAFRAWLRLD